MTGPIFDNAKLSVIAWADFVLQALSFESVSVMSREDRRAEAILLYWMAKLFAVLDGIQGGVVVADRVWIDEKYWPAAAKDDVRATEDKLLRVLSRNQIFIAISVDEAGRFVFLREGFDKPGKGLTWAAFGEHIVSGSTLLHDKEYSNSMLVDRLNLINQKYDANTLKGFQTTSIPSNRSIGRAATPIASCVPTQGSIAMIFRAALTFCSQR